MNYYAPNVAWCCLAIHSWALSAALLLPEFISDVLPKCPSADSATENREISPGNHPQAAEDTDPRAVRDEVEVSSSAGSDSPRWLLLEVSASWRLGGSPAPPTEGETVHSSETGPDEVEVESGTESEESVAWLPVEPAEPPRPGVNSGPADKAREADERAEEEEDGEEWVAADAIRPPTAPHGEAVEVPDTAESDHSEDWVPVDGIPPKEAAWAALAEADSVAVTQSSSTM
eukprot:EG_transcript_18185